MSARTVGSLHFLAHPGAVFWAALRRRHRGHEDFAYYGPSYGHQRQPSPEIPHSSLPELVSFWNQSWDLKATLLRLNVAPISIHVWILVMFQGLSVFFRCIPVYQAYGLSRHTGCVSGCWRERGASRQVCVPPPCVKAMVVCLEEVNTSMILPSACKWGSRAQTRVSIRALFSGALPLASTRLGETTDTREVTVSPAEATWARDSSLEILLSST